MKVLLIHFLDITLQLVLFLVQELHISTHELLHVKVVVTSAAGLGYGVHVLLVDSFESPACQSPVGLFIDAAVATGAGLPVGQGLVLRRGDLVVGLPDGAGRLEG